MAYTLAAAAAATGLNKTTVLRAIKSGRISGTKNEVGEWQVEPAELHRVFPPAAIAAAPTDASQRYAPPSAPTDVELHQRTLLAEQRLSDLKGLLDDMRAQRDDMREQRDKWQTQAERLAAGLLTDQRPKRRWQWW